MRRETIAILTTGYVQVMGTDPVMPGFEFLPAHLTSHRAANCSERGSGAAATEPAPGFSFTEQDLTRCGLGLRGAHRAHNAFPLSPGENISPDFILYRRYVPKDSVQPYLRLQQQQQVSKNMAKTEINC